MMKKIWVLLGLLLVVILAAGCGAPPESAATATPDSALIGGMVDATLTAVAAEMEDPSMGIDPPPLYTFTPTPEAVNDEPPDAGIDPPPLYTFTPTPTATPTPTPITVVGDPAEILGEPNGVDYFDTFANWTNFDSKCFKSEITGTQYEMIAKGQAGVACWEVSWPMLENFYIETLIEMPEKCLPDDRFGMLFRAPDNDRGYLYGFTCDGRFTLTAWDGIETTTVLIPLTGTSAIDSAPGAKNRMGFLVQDADIYLYANGLYLGQTRDITYLDPGKIGYYVRASTEETFTVAYDYLKVWVVEDDFYPVEGTPPPLPTVPVPKPDPNQVTGTSTVNLNVRSGPGLQFTVLGTVEEGTAGEILGLSPDGDWYAVRVDTSVIGNGTAWVMGQYVTLSNLGGQTLPVIDPPLLPSKLNVPQPGPNDPQVTMLETATIRQGPTTEFPVFGVTSVGSKAIVVGDSEDGAWWAIKLETTTGWVYKTYTYAQKTDNVPVIKTPELPGRVEPAVPGTGAPAAVALEPINVRSGPGNTYESYGRIAVGMSMAVIGRSVDREWLVVNLPKDISPNGQGWVAARYVQAENISNVPVINAP